jgi:hypothetical protein
MDAFDECNLNWDTILNLLEVAADAPLLSLLAQTCREFHTIALEDKYWHACFGECIAVVPADATTWRKRYQFVFSLFCGPLLKFQKHSFANHIENTISN